MENLRVVIVDGATLDPGQPQSRDGEIARGAARQIFDPPRQIIGQRTEKASDERNCGRLGNAAIVEDLFQNREWISLKHRLHAVFLAAQPLFIKNIGFSALQWHDAESAGTRSPARGFQKAGPIRIEAPEQMDGIEML